MPLIAVEKAQATLQAGAKLTMSTETVTLEDALNRIVAEDQIATVDVPPAPNSAMDGYALAFADIESGTRTFKVSQRIPAGTSPEPLEPGTAVRLFTGAPLPDGADVVVMQENCEAADGTVTLVEPPAAAGVFVRQTGSDIGKGARIIDAGTRLRPQHLGILASIGIQSVPVYRKPRVAVFSTGDELVMPGQPLAPGQIYNSNRYLLAGLLTNLGCEVANLTAVADTHEATVEALKEGAAADAIISTGGVSVGEEDHVTNALAKLGELNMWKLNIKPGKPFAYGNIEGTPFFGLPGNPVSVFVTFMLLVKPNLQIMQGETDLELLRLPAIAAFEWSRPASRQEYLRGRLISNGTELKVELFESQDSAVLSSVAWSDCLVELKPKQSVKAGDSVVCLLV